MISSPGVGSGLDIENIVSSLMRLERRPLEKLQKKQDEIDVRLSALGRLGAAISDLQSAARDLQDRARLGHFLAKSSNEDILTASPLGIGTEETHQIEVLQLAQAHRLASAAYDSEEASVPADTYSFALAGESFEVTLDQAHATLKGLRDAINRAPDNPGISASIINVDGGSRLVLTAEQSGAANVITAPAGFTEIDAAQDAIIEVDGFTATAPSNRVSGVIPGLTLELKRVGTLTDPQTGATQQETVTVTTQADKEAMKASINDFVTAYNNLVSLLGELRQGDLRGEGLLLNVESTLRTQFFSPVTGLDGTAETAFDFGLTFNKEGVLSLDDTKLGKAVDGDLQKLLHFFTAEDGFGHKLEDALDSYVKADGFISLRKDGLYSTKKRYDLQIDSVEYRLSKLEERYRREFTQLDTLMSQLNGTSNRLQQQLNALPLAGKG